jgi:hypothetical protein
LRFYILDFAVLRFLKLVTSSKFILMRLPCEAILFTFLFPLSILSSPRSKPANTAQHRRIMEQIEEYWALIVEKTAAFGPLEWGATGAAGLLLFLLPVVLGGGTRRRNRPLPVVPMHLTFHTFQMAPLGRDAFLKIHNTRDRVTLLSAAIKRSKFIIIKNALAGHEFEAGKVYGILLEAIGKDRMLPDFEVVITYMDAQRNVFRQSFFPELQGAKPPKRIRRG